MNIKLFISDVDGTLTDGGMYYSESGEIMKKFNTRDAFGLRLLKENGIELALISGEDSPIVRSRASKLNIDKVYLGISDKLSIVKQICLDMNINLINVAYIGDDLNDLEPIEHVGLSFAVGDAEDAIKNQADIITTKNGGYGAVREASNYILSKIQTP
tara:strand:- start:24593 stop:25066 length:474 start_codon:yes stop_codon:yes gene_type:complete